MDAIMWSELLNEIKQDLVMVMDYCVDSNSEDKEALKQREMYNRLMALNGGHNKGRKVQTKDKTKVFAEIIKRLEHHPTKYIECGQARPCYNISCEWHMIWVRYYSQKPWKYILRFSQRKILKEIEEMPDTCVLDVAAEGGCTITRLGQLLGISHQAIHQMVYHHAMPKLKAVAMMKQLHEEVNAH